MHIQTKLNQMRIRTKLNNAYTDKVKVKSKSNAYTDKVKSKSNAYTDKFKSKSNAYTNKVK